MAIVSKAEYAKHRKCTRQYIHYLCNLKAITPEADGRIDVEKADHALAEKSQKAKKYNRKVVSPHAYEESTRQEWLTVKTQREKLKLAREIKQVIPVAKIVNCTYQIGREFRDNFLSSALSIAPALVNKTEVKEIQDVLHAKYISLINELMERLDKIIIE
jgi:predicted component of type VI protein secretion system